MRLRITENDVAEACLCWLRLGGWRVHRLEADLRGPKARANREEAGTPDYICLRLYPYLAITEKDAAGVHRLVSVSKWRPAAFYLECKRPGGKLRASQEIWIADARKRGWTVIVASSIDDLEAALARERIAP